MKNALHSAPILVTRKQKAHTKGLSHQTSFSAMVRIWYLKQEQHTAKSLMWGKHIFILN